MSNKIKGNPLDVLTTEDIGKLEQLLNEPKLSLSKAMEILGLDKSNDLRNTNLSGISFTGQDLKGYNLEGANLDGCNFLDATGLEYASSSPRHKNRLNRLLEEKAVLLADGASGTNFFNMGLVSGEAPEAWNIKKPHLVAALHRAFVDSGSDIILTNSFGANSYRLKLHRLHNLVYDLNRRAAEIAVDVADLTSREVVVAGSVGPTGELFEPLGELTFEVCVNEFKTQMLGLKIGGAHIIWIETMSDPKEMRAAARAAELVGMDYVITASFDTAGRTMFGMGPAELPSVVEDGLQPLAVGANCGFDATNLLFSILEITATSPDTVVIAKANAGTPEVLNGMVSYTGTPELMAQYARLAIDGGARIIGGCCGTSPEHIAAMRDAIDHHSIGSRPSLDLVEQHLGAPTNKTNRTRIAASRRHVRSSK